MLIGSYFLWFQALIRHALETINDKLKLEFGSRCLSICFRNAQADEVQDFNKVVCESAIDMAMGQYMLVLFSILALTCSMILNFSSDYVSADPLYSLNSKV